MRASPEMPPAGALSFRLYVAAASPNTRRALQNLQALCSAAGHATYDLKIIDVLQEPQISLRGLVFGAPMGRDHSAYPTGATEERR